MQDERNDETAGRGPSRREFVSAGSAALLAAAAVAGVARAAGEHDHHEMVAGKTKAGAAPAAPAHAALVAALDECLSKGRICLAHCHQKALAGEHDLAECAYSVDAMLRVCDATAWLAALDSKHLAAMRPVCQAVCEDCEKACREHEDHHAACRDCAEACAATIAELKKSA